MKATLLAKQSYLLALALTLGLIAWLYSGPRQSDQSSAVDPATLGEKRDKAIRVRTSRLTAQRVVQKIILHGRTQAVRAVTLKAELDGRVIELGAGRGTRVSKGDVIARLDRRELDTLRSRALAAVDLRELQYRAASKLAERDFQSKIQLAETFANLESARTELRRIDIDIGNAVLRAPFDGVLEQRPVEVGDYLTEGQEVARILEQHPMLITGDVNQQERDQLTPGAPGTARLITGEVVEGRVRYIASESDDATRTFRIELEVPNPDGKLVSGITAELELPTSTLQAHRISPALLSLDKANRIGLKTVTADSHVKFMPVSIARSSADGLWVSGLPATLDVITIGQGFVRDGDEVIAVPQDTGAEHPGTGESAAFPGDAAPLTTAQ